MDIFLPPPVLFIEYKPKKLFRDGTLIPSFLYSIVPSLLSRGSYPHTQSSRKFCERRNYALCCISYTQVLSLLTPYYCTVVQERACPRVPCFGVKIVYNHGLGCISYTASTLSALHTVVKWLKSVPVPESPVLE